MANIWLPGNSEVALAAQPESLFLSDGSINPLSPHAHKLVVAWNLDKGQRRNTLSPLGPVNLYDGAAFSASRPDSVFFDGTSNAAIKNHHIDVATGFSGICTAERNAHSANALTLFSDRTTAGGIGAMLRTFYDSLVTDGEDKLNIVIGSFNLYTNSNIFTPGVVNEVIPLAFAADAGNNETPYVIKDGGAAIGMTQFIASSSDYITVNHDIECGSLYVRGDAGYPGSGWDGWIRGSVLLWRRYVPEWEMRVIQRDLQRFLKPANDAPFLIGTAAAGGVTGDLAAQESGADSAALTGTITVQGDLSAQESGADTAAISGSMSISGTLAAQEISSDTSSITGAVLVAGTLSVQETGADTAAINGGTGDLPINGDLAAQESGSDTGAITGTVHVSGTLVVQETGADTAAISGTSPATISGTLAVTETGTDSAAIVGALLVQGTLATQEVGTDAAAFVGSVTVQGAVIAQETDADTAAFSFQEPDIAGALAAQESGADVSRMGGLIIGNYDEYELLPIDAAFAIHGEPAIYTAADASVSVIKAIHGIAAQFLPNTADVSVRGTETNIYVRSSEIATPARGDKIFVNGTTYKVDGFDQISEYEWVLYADA